MDVSPNGPESVNIKLSKRKNEDDLRNYKCVFDYYKTSVLLLLNYSEIAKE